MTTLSEIGAQLRVARERQKLFKTTLAQASGVHRNTLSDVEAGAGNVELNTLIAICKPLGLDICLVPTAVSNLVCNGDEVSSALSKRIARQLSRAKAGAK